MILRSERKTLTMTIKEFVRFATEKFNSAGIDSAESEARFFVCGYLDLSSTEYILKSDEVISDEALTELHSMVTRRIDGEPLQYIIGKWDFMGRTFKVGPGVLIPRPETEILCEKAIDYLKEKKTPTVYDLCAGSGCIGLTLKKECPDINIYLVEKSLEALEYLQYNASDICKNTFLTITAGNVLYAPAFRNHPKADLIISNPPYIKSSELPLLQKEVQREPAMALDGGEDGLIFYRYIIQNWPRYLKKKGVIMFEIGEDQSEAVSKLFEEAGFYSRITKDYNNHDRIIEGRRQPYDI